MQPPAKGEGLRKEERTTVMRRGGGNSFQCPLVSIFSKGNGRASKEGRGRKHHPRAKRRRIGRIARLLIGGAPFLLLLGEYFFPCPPLSGAVFPPPLPCLEVPLIVRRNRTTQRRGGGRQHDQKMGGIYERRELTNRLKDGSGRNPSLLLGGAVFAPPRLWVARPFPLLPFWVVRPFPFFVEIKLHLIKRIKSKIQD